jgi:hypothetical protein
MLIKDPLAFIVRSIGLNDGWAFSFLVTVTSDLSDNAIELSQVFSYSVSTCIIEKATGNALFSV